MTVESDAVLRDLEVGIADLAGSVPGRLGVVIRLLEDDLDVRWNADELFPSASIIKVPIMVEAYRQAEAGVLDLDEMVLLCRADMTGGSGLLQFLHLGLTLTIADAIELMIAVSDNSATNVVLRRIGVDAVNNSMQRLGLTHTWSAGPLIQPPPGGGPRRLSETTPRDMAVLLSGIAQAEVVSATACDAMLATLEHQVYGDMLPRYLPITSQPERLAPPDLPVCIAHKTGALSGVRNDTGVLTLTTPAGPRRAVISAFTADLADEDLWTVENVGERTVAAVGRLTYLAMLRLAAIC